MIYFVEDDNSIRELVIYTLNSQGMESEGFARPSDFWAAMQQKTPSLILLDIMLPEEDGLLLEEPELGRLVEAELLDEAETSCEPSSEEAPDELPAELEDPEAASEEELPEEDPEALSLEELSEELEELEEPEETPPSKETVKVLLTTWLPL